MFFVCFLSLASPPFCFGRFSSLVWTPGCLSPGIYLFDIGVRSSGLLSHFAAFFIYYTWLITAAILLSYGLMLFEPCTWWIIPIYSCLISFPVLYISISLTSFLATNLSCLFVVAVASLPSMLVSCGATFPCHDSPWSEFSILIFSPSVFLVISFLYTGRIHQTRGRPAERFPGPIFLVTPGGHSLLSRPPPPHIHVSIDNRIHVPEHSAR